MTVMEITSQRGKAAGDGGSAGPLAPEARAPADKTPDDRVAEPSRLPEARTPAKRPMRMMPLLITLPTRTRQTLSCCCGIAPIQD